MSSLSLPGTYAAYVESFASTAHSDFSAEEKIAFALFAQAQASLAVAAAIEQLAEAVSELKR
ncbi:hypothetical protein [Streptosporangium roseum]|uniref:hypothetical protein n=1 Tax=Streptosporangium roseum TaxID=2001 RepID=UPI0012DEF1DB|nr:hypothetical protein [Streptosporangium roseum]